jgi:hypothetical protein
VYGGQHLETSMAITIRNFRPRAVVMNFGPMRGRVQFIAEEVTPSAPSSSKGIMSWIRRRRRPKVPKAALSIALTQEAFGFGQGGLPLQDGIATFNDDEFADFVELLREVTVVAVPRMHPNGEIPEREACVDDLDGESPFKDIHARIIWSERGKVALYYIPGFGATFYPWAVRYHPDTNLPHACKALDADVMVIVPRVCRRTPELARALTDARGRRYKF